MQQDHTGCVQLFRNGCAELVGTDLLLTVDGDRSGIIEPSMCEFPMVRLDVPTIAQALASMGIPAPAYVFVSLTGISRRLVRVRQSGRYSANRALPAFIDDIVPPPVYVEDFGADLLPVLRPAFNVVWNAVGIVKSQTDFEEDSVPPGPSLPARPASVRPTTGPAGGVWPASAGQRGTIARRRLVAFLLHATSPQNAAMNAIDHPRTIPGRPRQ
ncbi:hypothetical protein P3T43_006840 [Paraburkholderia sp. GAS41]|uniref:hypothetical protein n=1 Tax=Paraburkholderia sp. GAS41 TaxID=3035134 RepID=UPI003D25EA70